MTATRFMVWWSVFVTLLFASSFNCEKDDKKPNASLVKRLKRPEIGPSDKDPSYASAILNVLDHLGREKESFDNLQNHNSEKYEFQPELESSLLLKDKSDDDDAYNSMIEYYSKNYGLQNNTEHQTAIKEMLKKLLYGVPVFFGYYRVFSYLNEICVSGGICTNVTVTTSVTSTKKKSTSFTETSVLTSMKTKTATRTISETSTKPATSVKTTTLPATSTTYRTNTKTLKSTITTTTTTNTKRTFTYRFSETTTTTRYSIRSRTTTTMTPPPGRMDLLFDAGDEEFIEIFPTAGDEFTSTYAWSKFSAVMSSLETTTDAEDDEEWTTRETTTPEYDDQIFNQRNLFMPLEGSKSLTVEASSISYDY